MLLLLRGAVVLDEAGPLAALDHVLQAEEVPVVQSNGDLLRERDGLEGVLQEALTVARTPQLFDLLREMKTYYDGKILESW